MKPLFNPVKGILDQGVMHGSNEDTPLRPHPEVAVGIDYVPDQRAVPPGNHFKEVPAVEAIRQSLAFELESDTAARRVFRHAVPHGAMTAPGPFRQRGIELHGGESSTATAVRRPGEGVERGCPA